MNAKMQIVGILLSVCGIVVLSSPTEARLGDNPTYIIIDLGDLVDRVNFPNMEPRPARALAINNRHEITGWATNELGDRHAFIYFVHGADYGFPAPNPVNNTRMWSLGTLAMNDAGESVFEVNALALLMLNYERR